MFTMHPACVCRVFPGPYNNVGWRLPLIPPFSLFLWLFLCEHPRLQPCGFDVSNTASVVGVLPEVFGRLQLVGFVLSRLESLGFT